MRVNKDAGTFPMASFDKKICNHRKKMWGEKIIDLLNGFCQYAIEDNQVA